jgi:hypothetical protein
MPELTLVPMAYCASPKTRGPFAVAGSDGRTSYEVRFDRQGLGSCTCPAFRFRRRVVGQPRACTHTLRVEREARCGWGELWGEPIRERGVCPACGGPTERRLTGV